MHENLLAPSNVILYGRVMLGLTFDPASLPAARGQNDFLRDQLDVRDKGKAQFARIYAMSYEGSFYNLPKPTIFLVHGDGQVIRGGGLSFQRGAAQGNLRPTTTDSGLAARDFEFEASHTGAGAAASQPGHDLRYWEYDKCDLSLRLDVVSGTLEEILVDATLSATSRYAITSRSDLAARSDLASRSDLAARSDLASRSDLVARHRLRS